jgi:hypothetical protein
MCWKHQAFAIVSRCSSLGMGWPTGCHPELATGATAGRRTAGSRLAPCRGWGRSPSGAAHPGSSRGEALWGAAQGGQAAPRRRRPREDGRGARDRRTRSRGKSRCKVAGKDSRENKTAPWNTHLGLLPSSKFWYDGGGPMPYWTNTTPADLIPCERMLRV